MSDGTKRPHGEMLGLAMEVVGMLAMACTRIAIAGSIRRGKDMVGDIEIVCAPAGNLLYWQLDALLAQGTIQQRRKTNGSLLAWGERYRAGVYKGAALDVFIVLADRPWGVTYLLRTGPGEANEVLVTLAGVTNRHGMRGIMPRGMRLADGALWRGDVRLDTPDEVDVFEAVGLPFIAANLRTAAQYQRWARPDSGGQRWVGSEPLDGDVWMPTGERKLLQVPVAVPVGFEAPVAMRQERLL